MEEHNIGKLLFDESPLVIQKKLAMKFGVDEALFIQQLHYLIANKQNGSDFSTVKEGYVWVYNAWWGWQEFFPFWNEKKIKRMIKRLEDAKVLVGRSDLNNMAYDKTKWYRIDYDELMNTEEINYFEKEGKKEKAKKLERILKAQGQSVPMSNTKDLEAPKTGTMVVKPCAPTKGHNVPMEKDIMSPPIPKTSIPKISLLDSLVSMYVPVEYSPIECFKMLIKDDPSKYVQIELGNLENKYGKDFVNEAIKRLADKNTTKYIATIKGILKNWTSSGAKTLEDVKRIEDEHKKQYKQKKQAKGKGTKTPVREEMVPEWVGKENEEQPSVETEEGKRKRKEIEEKLKKFT